MNDQRRTTLATVARFLEAAQVIIDEVEAEEAQAHDNTGHMDKLDYNIALLDASMAVSLAAVTIEGIALGKSPEWIREKLAKVPARLGLQKPPTRPMCPRCATARGAGTTRCWAKGCGDETPLDQCPSE
jgi:hypothetical protein